MTYDFDSYITSILEAFTPMTGDTHIDNNRKTDHVKGNQTEELFHSLIQKRNLSIRPASQMEEVNHHVDFFVTLQPNVVKSFEVKPQSKDGTFYAIELIGRTGMPGPIYGKADYLAFCNPSKQLFYVVEREKLKNFVEKTGRVKVTDRWGNLSTDNFQTVDNIADANLMSKLFYHRKNAAGTSSTGLMTNLTIDQMRGLKSFILN